MEFSTENLIKMLNIIKNEIENNTINITTQERIWNALLVDNTDAENAELIKYLFTGWWIHNNLNITP